MGSLEMPARPFCRGKEEAEAGALRVEQCANRVMGRSDRGDGEGR